MDRQSNDVCLIMRQHDLLPICAAGDMQSLLGVTFEQLRQDVMLLADALEPFEERALDLFVQRL